MGIKSLFPFLTDNASLSIKETKVEAMTGRTIAIDASMCLYQFLVAVRQGESQANLSNAAGEVTSHIQGFLSRTVRLLVRAMRPLSGAPSASSPRIPRSPALTPAPRVEPCAQEAGVKPVYVFDGKPPELKRQTLASRAESKEQADADLAAALEGGDSEEIRKAAHRTAGHDLDGYRAARPSSGPTAGSARRG